MHLPMEIKKPLLYPTKQGTRLQSVQEFFESTLSIKARNVTKLRHDDNMNSLEEIALSAKAASCSTSF